MVKVGRFQKKSCKSCKKYYLQYRWTVYEHHVLKKYLRDASLRYIILDSGSEYLKTDSLFGVARNGLSGSVAEVR